MDYLADFSLTLYKLYFSTFWQWNITQFSKIITKKFNFFRFFYKTLGYLS